MILLEIIIFKAKIFNIYDSTELNATIMNSTLNARAYYVFGCTLRRVIIIVDRSN